MISPADIFCLSIIAGLILIEAHRGIIPALIGFLGILGGLILTRIAYVPLSEYMLASGAYMLLMGVLTLLTAVVSTVVFKRLRMHVTEVEAAIGAIIGLGTGLLLSYAFFEWLTIRYGGASSLIRNSLLYWAMMEFAGLREVADFFRKLTGR